MRTLCAFLSLFCLLAVNSAASAQYAARQVVAPVCAVHQRQLLQAPLAPVCPQNLGALAPVQNFGAVAPMYQENLGALAPVVAPVVQQPVLNYGYGNGFGFGRGVGFGGRRFGAGLGLGLNSGLGFNAGVIAPGFVGSPFLGVGFGRGFGLGGGFGRGFGGRRR